MNKIWYDMICQEQALLMRTAGTVTAVQQDALLQTNIILYHR